MSKVLTWLFQQAAIPFELFYSFLPSTMVSTYLQTAASPEEELLQICVRARAITCPIFQCFVCLCEIVSTNCQSSCIPKHSYMHNHASYMFMHLIKLLCYSYASAFSIPMSISIKINRVNFKFLLPTINVYCHINFKIQTVLSTPLSNSSSCSYVYQIQSLFKYNLFLLTAKWLVHLQEQLVPVNLFLLSGQAASSHPRTACTYPFDIRRVTSSDPRTTRAFYFVSRQPSNQFISKNSLCFLCFLSAK